jgi:hypothetical protein
MEVPMEVRVLSRGKAGVDWPAEVERWRSGGMSRAAFCRARELPYPSFIYWEKKLGTTKAQRLVEIPWVPQSEAAKPEAAGNRPEKCAMRIHVADVLVELEPDFQADSLERLLEVLRRRP